MKTTDLSLNNPNEIIKQNIWKDILASLEKLWVWHDKLAAKLWSLLDAKTINNNWDVMADNKAQLDTLKLVLKMHWLDLSSNKLQINLFNNIPQKNDKLIY
jgi:hypothetical protein